jgi:hypothetical protein
VTGHSFAALARDMMYLSTTPIGSQAEFLTFQIQFISVQHLPWDAPQNDFLQAVWRGIPRQVAKHRRHADSLRSRKIPPLFVGGIFLRIQDFKRMCATLLFVGISFMLEV